MLPSVWQSALRGRVLAVRLDNIGDVVLLGPALRALRRELPQAHLTLMASPAGAQVAPLLPWIDEVLVHRAVWQDASAAMALSPEREWATIELLRNGRYDASLIFTSFSQSPYPPAFACYMAGIPLRIGQSREFGGSLLSHWVRPLPDEAHQVDRNLFLLESAGFHPADRELELRVPGPVQVQADERLRAAGVDPERPFIVLAPGASCAARRYDAARFAGVARLVAVESGLPLVVVGNAREGELAAMIVSAAPAGRAVSLAGQTTIPELAAVIGRSALLVGNDSGPMHIADALRRPMVILFSGTEHESQWRPRSAPARLLRRPTDCSPCYYFRCPYHMECLDIPPAGVAGEVLSLLRHTSTAAKRAAGLRGERSESARLRQRQAANE